MIISGKVILKKGKEGSIKRFHPWIFSGAIQSLEGNPEDGDWVHVTDSWGHILGVGHYQKGTITVRVVSFSNEVQTEKIWEEKIISKMYLNYQNI